MKQNLLCLWVVLALLVGGIGIPAYAGDEYAPRSPMDRPIQQPQQSVASYYGQSDYRSNPPGELIIVDTLILRPFGIISCAIGLGSSILSLPWASSSDSFERVDEELVRKPFSYTFERKLGDLEY